MFRLNTKCRLLREKQYRDEEFVEICKLRQGAALHTLDSLLELPVSRKSFHLELFFRRWFITPVVFARAVRARCITREKVFFWRCVVMSRQVEDDVTWSWWVVVDRHLPLMDR
jgi:hypothetical protein